MSEQTKDIALRNGQVQLNTLEDAERFAQIILKSGFAPKSYTRASQIIIAVQTGAELGLSPMQSLQGIAVINGKPSLYGDTLKALVEASPECEWVMENISGTGEDMVAVCNAKRRGREESCQHEFSVADARTAKLWGKPGPWTQYPKRMLQMRARSFCLRDQFADLLCGLIAAEEAHDYPQEDVIESGDVVPTMDLDSVAEQAEADLSLKDLEPDVDQSEGHRGGLMEQMPTEPTIDEQMEAEDAEKAAKKTEEENEDVARGEPVVVDEPLFPL